MKGDGGLWSAVIAVLSGTLVAVAATTVGVFAVGAFWDVTHFWDVAHDLLGPFLANFPFLRLTADLTSSLAVGVSAAVGGGLCAGLRVRRRAGLVGAAVAVLTLAVLVPLARVGIPPYEGVPDAPLPRVARAAIHRSEQLTWVLMGLASPIAAAVGARLRKRASQTH